MTTAAPAPPGFATQLRTATAEAHELAETTRFVGDLMAGDLDLTAYAALMGQLRHVYAALETVGDRLRDDPVAGAFVDEDLRRLPSLEADLADLADLGADARDAQAGPATTRYVARLRGEIAGWPGGFVAHHYTRYLGDLAGGQAIRAAVVRHYGLTEGRGTRFFVFDGIPKPKVWRDAYRARLDATPFDPDEQARVAAEAVHAFTLNTELFLELGTQFRPA